MSHNRSSGCCYYRTYKWKTRSRIRVCFVRYDKRYDRHPRHPEPSEAHAMDTAILMAELALAVTALVSITRALVMQIQRN